MSGKVLKGKINLFISVAAAVLFVLGQSITAHAEDAMVHFGSTDYTATAGESFPVGVYINTESGTGSYVLTVTYDPTKLVYVGGADGADPENGVLAFVGDSGGPEVRYMLTFTALEDATDTSINFSTAEVYSYDTGEALNTVVAGTAPITVNAPEETEEENEEEETEEAEEEIEEDAETEETEETEESEEENAEDGQAEDAETEEETEPVIETIVYDEAESEAEETKGETSILYNSYFIIAVIFIAVVVLIQVAIALLKRFLPALKLALPKEEPIDDEDVMDLDEEELQIDEKSPVIAVDDVTMEFHIAGSNVSGIKDYIIQFLKRQISYRKLFALYHVSFNIYRGEIVGIIGTNGSGKSTLLKIVSGALKPTEGEVRADRRKIQLLTLGTGFDMELTGRENVYLNGAIIGYSKEFLDQHYDEIVKFAELEDFMDEKVKNYSSGMVSRLGFAIATAGDAAEILILDEVLSVGDEFFRKKSLKRVKEMIHSGSTVLIVSHSMDTIISNCTKCVWIEKGRLQMVDEPERVCQAYRKMQGKEAV